jgi:predicted Abi (CAAX) family protease
VGFREVCVSRLRSLKLGFTTWPDARTWLRCGALLAAFFVVTGVVALTSDLFRFQPSRSMSGPALLLTALILFVRPSLIEEVLFRGILLPHPTQNVSQRRRILWAAASLAAFVLAHPVTASLFLHKMKDVFTNPLFLCVVLVLGLATTLAYLLSGSLWPAVFIHWVALLVWLLLFGGDRLLA